MRLIDKIETVNKVVNTSNFTYLFTKGGIELLFPYKKTLFKGDLVDLFAFSKIAIGCIDYEGRKLTTTTDALVKEFNSGIDGIQFLLDENTLIRTTYSDDFSITFLAKFDLLTCTDYWNIPVDGIGKIIYSDDYIALSNSNEIRLLDINNGGEKWSVINESYMVNDFILINDKSVFFSNNESDIIELNLQDGNQLRKLEGDKMSLNFGNRKYAPSNYKYCPQSDIIYGVIYHSIITIDLKSEEINFYSFQNIFKSNSIIGFKQQIEISSNNQDIFYVTASIQQDENDNRWSYDCILELSITSKEILSKINFEEDSLGVYSPIIIEDKILQQDNSANLFIIKAANNKYT